MKIDYNKRMEEIISGFGEEKKTLLIHSCCAPCNSSVLKRLDVFFNIIVYFYNPNINIPGEFEKRFDEQKRFIEESGVKAELIKGEFNPKEFLEAVKGFEKAGEGSLRCEKCFSLRLEAAAKKGKELGADYFTSSLTISPIKKAEILNDIGYKFSEIYELQWLPSDFKKKGGYQHSVNLSKEFNLYRQDYCGCAFSLRESLEREKNQPVTIAGHQ